MTRRTLILVALAAVVLAGCLGGPGAETTTDPTTGNDTATVSSADVPGVSAGTLTNATALARANEASLTATGGAVRVRHGAAEQGTAHLVVGADSDTYTLTSARTTSDDDGSIAIWGNETTRVIRTASGGESNYRLVERRDDELNLLERIETYLASGDFTVANETTGDGTVVFTADEYQSPADGHGPHTNVSSFTGRLVVGESGLIHNLSIAATDAQGSTTYSYDLLRTGVDRAAKPDWFDDVPASATLQPQLSVDVENSSYLAVRNEGGDHVPRNTTISVTMNNTTVRAPLATSLETGDSRYAYVDATTETLQLTTERPAAGTVSPVTSPISVAITTDDGVSLYSMGMAWGSETSAASDAESAGGSSGGSASASGGSASAGGSSSTESS